MASSFFRRENTACFAVPLHWIFPQNHPPFQRTKTQYGMKKKNDLSLQEAMQAMLREYRLEPQVNEARVKMLWVKLMGKTISTYTSNISVRKNVLYLTILSAPLKQELSYAKDKIKDLLNDEMGEEFVKDVVIR